MAKEWRLRQPFKYFIVLAHSTETSDNLKMLSFFYEATSKKQYLIEVSSQDISAIRSCGH